MICKFSNENTSGFSFTISPRNISENGGVSVGTLTQTIPWEFPQRIYLTSYDLTEATVPDFIDIPALAQTATFNITAVDDAIQDGSENVSIGASAASTLPGLIQFLSVLDDEEGNGLTLEVDDSSITEGGSTTATVTMQVPRDVETTISVSASGDEADTSVQSITFAPLQTTATFTVDGLLDDLVGWRSN